MKKHISPRTKTSQATKREAKETLETGRRIVISTAFLTIARAHEQLLVQMAGKNSVKCARTIKDLHKSLGQALSVIGAK